LMEILQKQSVNQTETVIGTNWSTTNVTVDPFHHPEPPRCVVSLFIVGVLEALNDPEIQNRRVHGPPEFLDSNYLGHTLLKGFYDPQVRHTISWQKRMMMFFGPVKDENIKNPYRKTLIPFYRTFREFQG